MIYQHNSVTGMTSRIFDRTSLCLVTQLIFIKWVYTVEVQLSGGLSPNQGRVELKFPDGAWTPVKDGSLGDSEAEVVCRQLGFKYGSLQSKAYVTTYPNFLTDTFNCNGSEPEFAECSRSEGRPISTKPQYYYAGVCCSNFPDFEERIQGAVIGHCAVTWTAALARCEAKSMTLLWSPHLSGGHVSRYWTGEFYTAWIWSDGCYKVASSKGRSRKFRNNSPQVCLQFCGDSPDTQFALSGTQCKCLGDVHVKTGLTQTAPSRCHYTCLGDTRYMYKCGDAKGKHWNIYSTAREEDIFYTVDPVAMAPSQCAVLLAEGFTYDKLRSEECNVKNGYICSDMRDNGFVGYVRFGNQTYYNVSLQDARRRCDSASTFHLTGRSVLQKDALQHKQRYNRLWVNIQRTIVAVQVPNSSGKLSPSLCVTVGQGARARMERHASHCDTRNLYSCATVKDIPSDDGIVDTPAPPSSSNNSSAAPAPGWLPIVLAVGGAVVLLTILTTVVLCFLRRKRRRAKQRHTTSKTTNAAQPGYEMVQKNSDNGQAGGIYDEIGDTDSVPENHVYYDLEDTRKKAALLQNNKDDNDKVLDEGHNDKAPLKEKISYAFPHDSVKDKHGVLKVKHSAGAPDYDTPYDSLLNKDKGGDVNGKTGADTKDMT